MELTQEQLAAQPTEQGGGFWDSLKQGLSAVAENDALYRLPGAIAASRAGNGQQWAARYEQEKQERERLRREDEERKRKESKVAKDKEYAQVLTNYLGQYDNKDDAMRNMAKAAQDDPKLGEAFAHLQTDDEFSGAFNRFVSNFPGPLPTTERKYKSNGEEVTEYRKGDDVTERYTNPIPGKTVSPYQATYDALVEKFGGDREKAYQTLQNMKQTSKAGSGKVKDPKEFDRGKNYEGARKDAVKFLENSPNAMSMSDSDRATTLDALTKQFFEQRYNFWQEGNPEGAGLGPGSGQSWKDYLDTKNQPETTAAPPSAGVSPESTYTPPKDKYDTSSLAPEDLQKIEEIAGEMIASGKAKDADDAWKYAYREYMAQKNPDPITRGIRSIGTGLEWLGDNAGNIGPSFTGNR